MSRKTEDDTDPATLAEIAAYERANDDASSLRPISEIDRKFAESKEYAELRALVSQVHDLLNTGGDVHSEIAVNRGFVMMLEFLEKKDAELAGRRLRSTQELIESALAHELHDTLHVIATSPLDVPFYRDLWNRHCDDAGIPEQKISDPPVRPVLDDPF